MKQWAEWRCLRSSMWMLIFVANCMQMAHAQNDVFAGDVIGAKDMQLVGQPEYFKAIDDINNKNDPSQLGKYFKRTSAEDEKMKIQLLQRLKYLTPYYTSKTEQMFGPAASKTQYLLPELLRTETFQPMFRGPLPRDSKRQGFSTWGGKRESANRPFKAWGGKRKPTSKPFTSWGGKRAQNSDPFTTYEDKREPNSRPFKAWGGKRSSQSQSFSSNEEPQIIPLDRLKRGKTSELWSKPVYILPEGGVNLIRKRTHSFDEEIGEDLPRANVIHKNSDSRVPSGFNAWAGKKRTYEE